MSRAFTSMLQSLNQLFIHSGQLCSFIYPFSWSTYTISMCTINMLPVKKVDWPVVMETDLCLNPAGQYISRERLNGPNTDNNR